MSPDGTFDPAPAKTGYMISTPPSHVSDDAVSIARSLTGEPEAFADVFDRWYPLVFRFASARLGPDLGEEVASQTFTLAWTSRARFDATLGSAQSWLLGIATNVIRDHRRAERRRWAAYDRAAREPIREVDEPDHREPMLGAALTALSRSDRDIVLLAAWAELSYEEIAHALDLPLGTVRSRLNRARARLRDALDPSKGTR